MQNPIRFVEGCTHNEDVIFCAKMFFCSQKIFYTDTFLYIYRKSYQSSTNTYRYSLKNAMMIPDAWEEATCYAKTLAEDFQFESERWVVFCKTMSSIRCLEVLRILCDIGYTQKEIETVFMEKDYFHRIEFLEIADLAEWQRQDLLQYKMDRQRFYLARRAKTKMLRNKLKASPLFRKIYELKKYNLSLGEINND